MLVWLVATLLSAPLALTLTSSLSGAGWEAQGSTSVTVRNELRRDFPPLGAEAAVVVYQQGTPGADDPAGLQALVADLGGAPGAPTGVDPLSRPADAGLISPDGTTVLVPVALDAETDADLPVAAEHLIDHVAEADLPDGARAEVTGEWAVWSDFNQSNEEALHKAELLSGIPTVILLLIAFGYSLFIVSRYREEREDGFGAEDAIATTLSTAGKAVFLSALAVVLSLAAVFVVPVMVFRSMALGMILAVVAVAFASLTLLPAVLVSLGDRVLVAKAADDPDRKAEGRWARWTGRALRHPGRTLFAGLALLLLLAVPAVPPPCWPPRSWPSPPRRAGPPCG